MLKRNNVFILVFILLFIDCKSQKFAVKNYFNKLEKQAFTDCMENDFTVYSLKKDPSNLNELKNNCRVREITYKRMSDAVMKLIESSQVRNTKNDFVIISAIASDLTIPASVISILKVKNREELFIINKDEEGNTTKESYNKNNHSLIEKRKDIIAIENYLMKNAKNNVSDTMSNSIESHSYHVVAKIKGKYIIKEMYCINN